MNSVEIERKDLLSFKYMNRLQRVWIYDNPELDEAKTTINKVPINLPSEKKSISTCFGEALLQKIKNKKSCFLGKKKKKILYHLLDRCLCQNWSCLSKENYLSPSLSLFIYTVTSVSYLLHSRVAVL